MTQPEELTQLELEHNIRYGSWEERAAHDPLPDPDETLIPVTDEASDDDTIPLTSADIDLLEVIEGQSEAAQR
jgi:hypothetical protein